MVLSQLAAAELLLFFEFEGRAPKGFFIFHEVGQELRDFGAEAGDQGKGGVGATRASHRGQL